VTEVVIVRSVTRGLYKIVMKVASVSGYLSSKCSAGFVCIWLYYKYGNRGNG